MEPERAISDSEKIDVNSADPQETIEVPLHESWKSEEEFEQYLSELAKWKEKLLLEKIEKDSPIEEELANYETILEGVGQDTADYARTTGRDGHGQSYFENRVRFFLKQVKLQLARSTPALRSAVLASPGAVKKEKKTLGSLADLAQVRDQIKLAEENSAPTDVQSREMESIDVSGANNETPKRTPAKGNSGSAQTQIHEEGGETSEIEPDSTQKHVEPPGAIEDVSREVSPQEIVDRLRGYFDVLYDAQRDLLDAERALRGNKKEGGDLNGFYKGLKNLVADRERLSKTPDSEQKVKQLQKIDERIAYIEKNIPRAEERLGEARTALTENIRGAVALLGDLPLPLKEAIERSGESAGLYDGVFREYNINPMVAQMVAYALNAGGKTAVKPQSSAAVESPDKESIVPEVASTSIAELPEHPTTYRAGDDGHIYDEKTGEQIDRPIVVPEKGDATGPTSLGSTVANPPPIVMSAEDGVVTYDQSLAQNHEQELLDKILKAGQPKAVMYPPVSTEQNPALTGIYDEENLPTIAVDTPKEEKIVPSTLSQEKTLTELSWDELRVMLNSGDVLRVEEANAEWERRAYIEAKRSGVLSALENTLEAIKEIRNGVVPEGWVSPPDKWLREFQSIPVVANYLATHPLPQPQVNRTGLSNKQIADDLDINEPKRFGRHVETTAETSFEIKEGKRKNTVANESTPSFGDVSVDQGAESKEGDAREQYDAIGSAWDSFLMRENPNDLAMIGYEAIVGRGFSQGESTAIKKILSLKERASDQAENERIELLLGELLDVMSERSRPIPPAEIREILKIV